jgi:hypothetical protein
MLTVTGNGELDALIARLASAGAEQHRPGLHKVAADACTDLVRLEFQDGKDPNGNKWVATQEGNDPPLTRTGAMRNSVESEVTSGGFTISITDRKAIWHQGGTRSRSTGEQVVPPRPMLPTDTLPSLWQSVMQEDGGTYLRGFLLHGVV